ncbi:SWIM zinc finger family protein [Halogeometricum pallidum]|uniref:SWIM zinc finger family protein n=1 Tax=Halogeometricum pallidum TaxID=411361 RepID=UPI000A069BF7|nr:SWIM zinc finger family protein [Halogeometricum pallidum]
MNRLLLEELSPTNRVLKRAQYEAFEFSLLNCDVQVRNENHQNPINHEYRVTIVSDVPAACECPADRAYDTPCKHRVTVAIRPRILDLVTKVQAATDGGTTADEQYDSTELDHCACDKLSKEFPCWNCVRTGQKKVPEK